MQKVIAGVSGMNTDSMWRRSASRNRNFSVPSIEVSRWASAGVVSVKSRASAARKSSDRSVIASTSVTPRRYTQRKRSEEHTSELQSLTGTSYAVFCLKKKIEIARGISLARLGGLQEPHHEVEVGRASCRERVLTGV